MEDLLGAIMVIAAIAISISKKMKKNQKQTTRPIADIIKEAVEEEFDLPVAKPASSTWPPKTEQASFLPQEKPEAPKTMPETRLPEREPVMGSLRVDTWEGVDPCHEEQMEEMESPIMQEQPMEAPPALQLDWKGEELMKAFIMQEVLTRPCQRRRA